MTSECSENQYGKVLDVIAQGRSGNVVDVRWFDRDGNCHPPAKNDGALKLSGHMSDWHEGETHIQRNRTEDE